MEDLFPPKKRAVVEGFCRPSGCSVQCSRAVASTGQMNNGETCHGSMRIVSRGEDKGPEMGGRHLAPTADVLRDG